MNAQTFEVELDHGKVRPINGGELPAHGRAILTMLGQPMTAGEIAKDLRAFKKLSTEEAADFIKDLNEIRASVPPPKSAWD